MGQGLRQVVLVAQGQRGLQAQADLAAQHGGEQRGEPSAGGVTQGVAVGLCPDGGRFAALVAQQVAEVGVVERQREVRAQLADLLAVPEGQ